MRQFKHPREFSEEKRFWHFAKTHLRRLGFGAFDFKLAILRNNKA
jgi:hypothetical protein